jgi:hypothetical protein
VPISKPRFQEKVARKITQAHPVDRPLVVFHSTAGAMPWLLDAAGTFNAAVEISTFFTRRNYAIALTEQAVVFISMARFTGRLKGIRHRISWPQAAALMGEVKFGPMGDRWFLFTFPGKRRSRRITVSGAWDDELRYFLSVINPAQAGR